MYRDIWVKYKGTNMYFYNYFKANVSDLYSYNFKT